VASVDIAPAIDRVRWVHRLGIAGLLVSLLYKHDFYRSAAQVYIRLPIDDDFFPALFQSAYAAIAIFLSIAIMSVLNFFIDNRRWQIAFSFGPLVGVSLLCLHQATYNDATFTTMWWSSLWGLWLVWRRGIESEQVLIDKAAFLSRVIVSMILFAGAVGKWTSEYWSGEVLHDIYFIDRKFWLFDEVRSRFSAETVRELATIYSRFVIVTETVGGIGLWCLPPRVAATVGIILLVSIALMSNFLLFSVMGCMIGILASGWFVSRQNLR
jgi:hypothetical protein